MPPSFIISPCYLSVSISKNSDWVPLTSLSHCKPLRTMTAVSRYMELTVEPVQQVSGAESQLGIQMVGRERPWKASWKRWYFSCWGPVSVLQHCSGGLAHGRKSSRNLLVTSTWVFTKKNEVQGSLRMVEASCHLRLRKKASGCRVRRRVRKGEGRVCLLKQ